MWMLIHFDNYKSIKQHVDKSLNLQIDSLSWVCQQEGGEDGVFEQQVLDPSFFLYRLRLAFMLDYAYSWGQTYIDFFQIVYEKGAETAQADRVIGTSHEFVQIDSVEVKDGCELVCAEVAWAAWVNIEKSML